MYAELRGWEGNDGKRGTKSSVFKVELESNKEKERRSFVKVVKLYFNFVFSSNYPIWALVMTRVCFIF